MLSTRIKFLFDLVHDIHHINSFDDLKKLIVNKTSEIFKAHRVSLMLYDEVRNSLKIEESIGISSYIVKKTETMLGEDISGLSLKEKKLFFVEDINKLSKKYGLRKKRGINSTFLIVIPLYIGDKLIGTLNITDLEEPASITKRDREIILSISSHVALAIERIRLIDFQKDKMNQAVTLLDMSNTLSSCVDIEDTIDSFVKIISSNMNIKKTAVFIYNENTRSFSYRRSSDIDNIELEDIGEIIQNIKEDLMESERAYFKFEVMGKDFYSIPLKYENKTIGLLVIEVKKSSVSKYDFNFLTILASQIAVTLGKEILLQKLRKEKEKFRLLNTLSKELSACFDIGNIVEILKDNLQFMFKYDIFSLVIFKKDYSYGSIYFQANSTKGMNLVEDSYRMIINFLKLNRKGLSDIEMKIKGLDPSYLKDNEQLKVGSHLIMPLIEKEKLKGVFFIGSLNNEHITLSEDLELFSIIGNYLASNLEKAHLFNENEKLAFTDPMTKCFNYRFFKNRISEEFDRSRRYKVPLCVMILDIDFFKYFNDNFGHQQGDSVLRETAEILRESVRSIDVVARYGGEEFVVIFPETSISHSVKIAERIRGAIENREFENINSTGKKLHITVSIGISELRDNMETISDIIEFSDACLYRAKNNGRNRICYYDGEKYREKTNIDS